MGKRRRVDHDIAQCQMDPVVVGEIDVARDEKGAGEMEAERWGLCH